MQYLLLEGEKSFDEAKVACEALGGSLPQIHSRVENEAILNMLPNGTNAYIWMNAIMFDHDLYYLTGERIDFGNLWKSGMLQCLTLGTVSKKWESAICEKQRRYTVYTVCQKEKTLLVESKSLQAIEAIRERFNMLKANLESLLAF